MVSKVGRFGCMRFSAYLDSNQSRIHLVFITTASWQLEFYSCSTSRCCWNFGPSFAVCWSGCLRPRKPPQCPRGASPPDPPALAIVHASATTCMHYGHSTHMYYGHSTCWYCSQSKCMYYGQSPCIYYGHSTCMYYGRDICMYSGHSTCMYYGHSTCMYYGLRTYMYYGHHRTCMYDGHINGHRTYSTANRPCCMAHSLSE